MSSQKHKEMAFLRRCLRYDESAAGRHLEERIALIQSKHRSLSRARWLVAFLAALAVAGLGYAAVFQDRFPQQAFVFTTLFITNAISAVCLGSLISLLAFIGLGVIYGRELNRLRDEGRRSITRFLESSLGTPFAANQNGHFKEYEVNPLDGEIPASAPGRANFSRAPGSP
jgi:hypothetical protein